MIYVGVLTAFFNIPPAIAASTSLATIIPTTAAGTFNHWRLGNINIRLGIFMLAGGIAGAIAGSLCSSIIPVIYYNKILGVIMLFLSAQMLLSRLKKKGIKKESDKKNISNLIQATIYGFLGGAMSGIIGLSGGGPIIAGLSILGCGALETVGTSVLVILGMSITGFFMHLVLGNVEWKLVGLLMIGTVSGALIGPGLLMRINRAKLEKILQPVLFVMVTLMGILLVLR